MAIKFKNNRIAYIVAAIKASQKSGDPPMLLSNPKSRQ